jgi:Protein of unknown function (DUF1826)
MSMLHINPSSSVPFGIQNEHSPSSTIESTSFSKDCAVLSEIREPGKNLAVWQRSFSPVLSNFLNGLCLPMPRQHKLIWSPNEDIRPALDKALPSFSPSQSKGLQAWRDDLLLVLAQARSLSPNQVLKIRLESVSSNGCRLFHTDNVALRIICTYRGCGTLWIPEHAIDRARTDRMDNAHVLDASAIRTLDSASVACMKGDAYPGQRNAGLFHRSPPAETAMPRILMAVDLSC